MGRAVAEGLSTALVALDGLVVRMTAHSVDG